jgi:hypothetical protein
MKVSALTFANLRKFNARMKIVKKRFREKFTSSTKTAVYLKKSLANIARIFSISPTFKVILKAVLSR